MTLQRGLILSVILVCQLGGCTNDSTPAESGKKPSERIHNALLGTNTNCERGEDCDSGVCQMGLCRSLLDSDQAWMERAVADRVRTYIESDPAVADELFGEHLKSLDGGDPFGQGRFASFMGHLGDMRALPILRKWCESKIERISALSWIARVRLRDAAAYSRGKAFLAHRSMALQLDALDALSPVLREADAVEDVMALLDSPKYRIRQRAVLTLGHLDNKPPKVVEALKVLLNNESDGFLRGDVLRALRQ